MTRRRGFTLIELLVVIAIIGILAAMLFPVFARARESARKTQCLANVKNIAIAFQMYLTDYDKFPPSERTAEAEAYFSTAPGKGGSGDKPDCNHKQHANPFIRWPVVLDDYTKNRDIWKCPSARRQDGASWIVNPDGPGGGGSWLTFLENNSDKWGRNQSDPDCAGGPCCTAWPPGWGGSVTDSVTQRLTADQGTGAFVMGIGYPPSYDLATSAIDDSAWWVVCGDAGSSTIWMASNVAMPDACRTGCGPNEPAAGCCSADWTNCSDSQSCGIPWDQKAKLYKDAQLRKPWTRHLGGSNLGFADGHAKWFAGDAIIAESPTYQDNNAGHLRNIGCIIDFCE